MFRLLNGVMAALFLFAAIVQYNDPDPLRWMAIYVAACAIAVRTAILGHGPRWPAAIVGVVALVWAIDWVLGVSSLGLYAHMFDAWEMKSVPVEEAREASGLLIVTVWMAVASLYRPRGR